MVNNLKIGDKLLCKRDMSNNSKHERFFFLRGEFYEVFRIYENYKKSSVIVEVMNERGYVTHFKLSGKPQGLNLYRYFHTPRQIRKIKLERISCIV